MQLPADLELMSATEKQRPSIIEALEQEKVDKMMDQTTGVDANTATDERNNTRGTNSTLETKSTPFNLNTKMQSAMQKREEPKFGSVMTQ